MDIDPKEATRRLAEVLYREMQGTRGLHEPWEETSRYRKIDFYDAILALSDQEIYWRVLFDHPDEDPVSGCAVIQNP